MEIIEVFANRRSGHHLFLSWLISNITNQKDDKTNKLNKITWLNDNVCHYNDISYHAVFNKEIVNNEVKEIINKNPKYFFINYEEVNILNDINDENSIIYNYKPTKIVFIRDFLNVMASKWAVSNTKMKEFYSGFQSDESILRNITHWKRSAKNYLSGDYIGFTYENLINDIEQRENFLRNNFGKKEIYSISELNGTNSSFNSKNFNERYKEVEFSERFRELVLEDKELNYLLDEMKYNKL